MYCYEKWHRRHKECFNAVLICISIPLEVFNVNKQCVGASSPISLVFYDVISVYVHKVYMRSKLGVAGDFLE